MTLGQSFPISGLQFPSPQNEPCLLPFLAPVNPVPTNTAVRLYCATLRPSKNSPSLQFEKPKSQAGLIHKVLAPSWLPIVTSYLSLPCSQESLGGHIKL